MQRVQLTLRGKEHLTTSQIGAISQQRRDRIRKPFLSFFFRIGLLIIQISSTDLFSKTKPRVHPQKTITMVAHCTMNFHTVMLVVESWDIIRGMPNYQKECGLLLFER